MFELQYSGHDVGKDRIKVPHDMDKNLDNYLPGESIKGEVMFTIDRANQKEIRICIKKLTCESQKRMVKKEE